jgi:hypothetical protein
VGAVQTRAYAFACMALLPYDTSTDIVKKYFATLNKCCPMFERCKGTTFFETSKSFLKKIFATSLAPLRGLGG